MTLVQTQELDSKILMGSFPFGVICDSMEVILGSWMHEDLQGYLLYLTEDERLYALLWMRLQNERLYLWRN